ncbi:MAG: MarR family transcriptional regulator [Alphaproteobacteria bacterium]|nr:MarR family transcriptional regulator [Alphaproteobacteria bacterium]
MAPFLRILHDEYAPAFFGRMVTHVIDRIVEGGVPVAEEQGIVAPVRTFSTMILLHHSALGVTDIAQALGITHAAVIKYIRTLSDLGLVERGRDNQNARRRPIFLTEKGKAQVELIDLYMRRIAEVYTQMFEEIGIDVYDGMRRMNDALDKRDFGQRMRED